MKKRMLLLSLIISGILLLTGCSSSKPDPKPSQTPSTTASQTEAAIATESDTDLVQTEAPSSEVNLSSEEQSADAPTTDTEVSSDASTAGTEALSDASTTITETSSDVSTAGTEAPSTAGTEVPSDASAAGTETSSDTAVTEAASAETEEARITYDTVDVDLTAFSSTMLYSTLTNMAASPDSYRGKTVKMKGLIERTSDSEGTIYYCSAYDDTLCCSVQVKLDTQSDSKSPKVNNYMTVVGIFDVYRESGANHCVLGHAVIL